MHIVLNTFKLSIMYIYIYMYISTHTHSCVHKVLNRYRCIQNLIYCTRHVILPFLSQCTCWAWQWLHFSAPKSSAKSGGRYAGGDPVGEGRRERERERERERKGGREREIKENSETEICVNIELYSRTFFFLFSSHYFQVSVCHTTYVEPTHLPHTHALYPPPIATCSCAWHFTFQNKQSHIHACTCICNSICVPTTIVSIYICIYVCTNWSVLIPTCTHCNTVS